MGLEQKFTEKELKILGDIVDSSVKMLVARIQTEFPYDDPTEVMSKLQYCVSNILTVYISLAGDISMGDKRMSWEKALEEIVKDTEEFMLVGRTKK